VPDVSAATELLRGDPGADAPCDDAAAAAQHAQTPPAFGGPLQQPLSPMVSALSLMLANGAQLGSPRGVAAAFAGPKLHQPWSPDSPLLL
jgi:hypothetical protein